MKTKLFIFFFFVFAYLSINAQDTIRIYYDENWKEISDKENAVFYRKAFAIDKNTWVAHDYYISNKIQMTGTYKSKKLEVRQGHFIYYYENGLKSSEGDYENNLSVGLWKEWYDNGQEKYEGQFDQGAATGDWKYWFETGELKSQGKYSNDKKVGIWKYYFTSGQLNVVETYSKAGCAELDSYYENGAKYSHGSVVDNRAEGTWTYWNVDGRIFLKGDFENGNRNGEWTRYFKNGEMKIQYKYGFMQGKRLGGVEFSE